MSNNKPDMFDKDVQENTQDKVSNAAKEFGKKAKSYVRSKEEELKEMANTYSEHVRENPIRSVLIGFVAGVIISKLFSKNGK